MSKCIYKSIADSLNKNELEEYYKTHLPKDVAEYFGFDQIYFRRIFDYLGIKRRNASENMIVRQLYYPETININPIGLLNYWKTACEEEILQRNAKISASQKGILKTDTQKLKTSKGLCRYYENHSVWNKGLLGVQTWVPGQKERYNATLKSNNFFKYSKAEEDYYLKLVGIFGKEDIERQYYCDRYPFKCDFYIKSRDLFIEFNRFWHHGPHPYNPLDLQDVELVRKWEAKSDEKIKQGYVYNQYSEAIKTWTERDVYKLKIAQENNLNYKTVY